MNWIFNIPCWKLQLILVFFLSNAITGRAVSTSSHIFKILCLHYSYRYQNWGTLIVPLREMSVTLYLEGRSKAYFVALLVLIVCRPHNSAHLGHVPCCYNRENLIKFSINILLGILLIFLEDLKVKIVNWSLLLVLYNIKVIHIHWCIWSLAYHIIN